MPFVILPTNSASGGYDITNSLRFNFASSDNLSRTPASSGNRNTWTLSFWFKKDINAAFRQIFNTSSTGNSNTTLGQIYFDTSDRIVFYLYTAGAEQANLTTTQKFRDPSAWYHIVIAYDDTQATASNRIKLYINGSQVTAFDATTYPSQNFSGYFNMNQPTFWGKDAQSGGSNPLSGYLSEAYFIDAQALTPSSFGETDSDTGIWKPKAYTGTYGTNGFYLQFKNSASLGTDSSGNGNNFTVNNLTSIDQTTDTPTNNFATWNPLYAYGNQTLTEGNLRLATGTSGASVGTIAVNTGKWYWEIKCVSITADARTAGISKLVANESLYNTSIYYQQNGDKKINNTSTAYGATLANGDIVGIAIDVDARSITFYKNGSSQGAIDISSVYSSGDYIIPALPQSGAESQTVDINFGNPPYSANSYTDGAGYGNFSYAVPSGYYSLNTKNLAQFG